MMEAIQAGDEMRQLPTLIRFIQDGITAYIPTSGISLAIDSVKEDGTSCLRIEAEVSEDRTLLLEIADPKEREQAELALRQMSYPIEPDLRARDA